MCQLLQRLRLMKSLATAVEGLLTAVRTRWSRRRRQLRASDLGAAYEAAWDEWDASGDSDAWNDVIGDGLVTRSNRSTDQTLKVD